MRSGPRRPARGDRLEAVGARDHPAAQIREDPAAAVGAPDRQPVDAVPALRSSRPGRARLGRVRLGHPVGVPRHRIAADDPPRRGRADARAAADDHGCRSRRPRRSRLDARAAWAGVDDLVTAVRDAASPGDALDRFTAFLESSRTLRPADAVVDHAVAAIQADPGQAIGDLAAQAGVSHRTLITRFRAAIGITPKAYAQLWRFHAFVRCRRRSVAVAGLGRARHGIRLLRPASRHPRVPSLHRLDAAEYYRRVVEFGPEAASFVPLEDLPIVED